MDRRHRLTGRKSFSNVFGQSPVWSNNLLVVRALPNRSEDSRYGFVVSKRVGKAVLRNRVRRRLREGVKSLNVPGGWDIVVTARPPAAKAPFSSLRDALRSLFLRAGLLTQDAASD
jgi:ribonuclease P protein component